jgi:ATP-dependent RNA helicase SUPV3L1/SUV3
MTSLTGSAGEDFASILRALGYRMERRPAPPPKPAVVEAAPAETEAAAQSEMAEPQTAEAQATEAQTAESATTESETEFAPETLSEVAAVEASGATANLVAGSAEPYAPDAQRAIEETPAPSATLLPEVAFLVSEPESAPEQENPQASVSVEAETPEAPAEQSIAESALAAPESSGASPTEAHAAAPDAASPDTVATPDVVAAPEMV